MNLKYQHHIITMLLIFGIVVCIIILVYPAKNQELPNTKSCVDTLMEYDYPTGYEYRLISSDGLTCKVTRKDFILAKGIIGSKSYYNHICLNGWKNE